MQKGNLVKESSDTVIEQMFKAGVHYGYSKTRRHPSVSKYIYTTKNKTGIIDLEKTSEMLEGAKAFIESLGKESKVLMFVGAKPESRMIIKNTAESLDMPYVIERWIGGTLSNFGEIKKRIVELEEYQKDMARGELEKYTKRERTMLAKKMEKLARYYGGLIGLKKIPDAIFIVDAKKEHIAHTEAVKSNVKVVALVNSDSDINKIDYPIVGNDSSVSSIKLFVDAVAKAYKKGQLEKPAPETTKPEVK